MKHTELLKKLARKTGVCQSDLDLVLKAFAGLIKEEVLMGGDCLRVPHVGEFYASTRKEKRVQLPMRPGVFLTIPARTRLAFRPFRKPPQKTEE
jgi:nucleoid DNA-binding protein